MDRMGFVDRGSLVLRGSEPPAPEGGLMERASPFDWGLRIFNLYMERASPFDWGLRIFNLYMERASPFDWGLGIFNLYMERASPFDGV